MTDDSASRYDTQVEVLLTGTHLTRSFPPFPQRSPPRLLTVAACGGLEPSPDGRLRRTYLHLLHSIAPRCVGTFVAHHRPQSALLAGAPDRSQCRRGWFDRSRQDPRERYLRLWFRRAVGRVRQHDVEGHHRSDQGGARGIRRRPAHHHRGQGGELSKKESSAMPGGGGMGGMDH